MKRKKRTAASKTTDVSETIDYTAEPVQRQIHLVLNVPRQADRRSYCAGYLAAKRDLWDAARWRASHGYDDVQAERTDDVCVTWAWTIDQATRRSLEDPEAEYFSFDEFEAWLATPPTP